MPHTRTGRVSLYFEETNTSPYWLPKKTPVLFIHGLSSDHTIWVSQVAAFSKERPAFSMDLRGHGRSDKPTGDVYEISNHVDDLLNLLNELGHPKTHLVAVSLGGMIAQQVALRAPDKVASISLICSSCEPPRSGATLEWRLKIFDEASDLEGYYGPVFERALMSSVPKDVKQYMYQLAIHNPRDLQRTAMIATFTYNAASAIGAIRTPTLVVGGRHDGSIPVELSEELAASIPGARLEILEDSGHAPYVEAPDSLTRVLKKFIADIEA